MQVETGEAGAAGGSAANSGDDDDNGDDDDDDDGSDSGGGGDGDGDGGSSTDTSLDDPSYKPGEDEPFNSPAAHPDRSSSDVPGTQVIESEDEEGWVPDSEGQPGSVARRTATESPGRKQLNLSNMLKHQLFLVKVGHR